MDNTRYSVIYNQDNEKIIITDNETKILYKITIADAYNSDTTRRLDRKIVPYCLFKQTILDSINRKFPNDIFYNISTEYGTDGHKIYINDNIIKFIIFTNMEQNNGLDVWVLHLSRI